MDETDVRVLVVAALGKVIEPQLGDAFTASRVRVAVNPRELRSALAEGVRYDVVLADLTWNDTELEYCFDGLDVLEIVLRSVRAAPVLLAAQGHGIERDHLDEAADRSGVAGTVRKADGVPSLVAACRRVAAGGTLPTVPSAIRPTLHEYFSASQRGETAARMAGAIAARRASNYDTLAAAAHCSRNTAIKLVDKYLGPLIVQRGEQPRDLPLTVQAVYRWCGEHSRYLVSWCRRHGHGDVVGAGLTCTPSTSYAGSAAESGPRTDGVFRAKTDSGRGRQQPDDPPEGYGVPPWEEPVASRRSRSGPETLP